MPAVSLHEDSAVAPLLARPYLAGTPPSPLFGALAHVPELLAPVATLMEAVYGPSALDDRLKEIVVLRVSVLQGCRYCVRVHRDLAAAAGLDAEDVAALCSGAPRDFGARERAAAAFAQAMCERPDDAVGAAAATFAEHELVELAALAGTTIFLNRFCRVLGLT